MCMAATEESARYYIVVSGSCTGRAGSVATGSMVKLRSVFFFYHYYYYYIYIFLFTPYIENTDECRTWVSKRRDFT